MIYLIINKSLKISLKHLIKTFDLFIYLKVKCYIYVALNVNKV